MHEKTFLWICWCWMSPVSMIGDIALCPVGSWYLFCFAGGGHSSTSDVYCYAFEVCLLSLQMFIKRFLQISLKIVFLMLTFIGKKFLFKYTQCKQKRLHTEIIQKFIPVSCLIDAMERKCYRPPKCKWTRLILLYIWVFLCVTKVAKIGKMCKIFICISQFQLF